MLKQKLTSNSDLKKTVVFLSHVSNLGISNPGDTADISGTGGLAPPIKHSPLVVAIVGMEGEKHPPSGRRKFDSQKLNSKL